MEFDRYGPRQGRRAQVAGRIRQALKRDLAVDERQRYRSGGGVLAGALVVLLLLNGGSRNGDEPCPQPTNIGVMYGGGDAAPQEATSGDARVTKQEVTEVSRASSGMAFPAEEPERVSPAVSGAVVDVNRSATAWTGEAGQRTPYGG